jgi:hypothetical protein
MRLAAQFSFKDGVDVIKARYPHLLAEVLDAIRSIDASHTLTKISKEKTMPGQILYSPVMLNMEFKERLYPLGWKNLKVTCDYPTEYYLEDYEHRAPIKGAFRDMDFVKERLGIEVQFGKYSFMVYNVCAKMTIFHNLGHIDCGIEVVPVKALSLKMSSGVSYFEQFVWDLRQRGVADIDIPVLILGIDV